MTYLKKRPTKTTLIRNTSYKGERLEEKIQRIMHNNEPITDGAPLVYTDRKSGVMPEYDIRTDRFEVAIDAMDKVTKTHQAKRAERHKPKEEAKVVDINKKDGGPESIQATDTK